MQKNERLWKSKYELSEILNSMEKQGEGVLKGYELSIHTKESSVQAVLELKKTLSSTSIKSFDDFLNFYLFINLFGLDISVVLHRYWLSKVDYELVFFGKSSALLIFEYLNTIHPVFNKYVKNAPGIFQPDIEEMKIILKQVAKIKKKHPELKKIRNIITAHRHANAFEYLRVTNEIDSHDYVELALEVMNMNTALYHKVVSSLKKVDAVLKKNISGNKSE